MGMAVSLTHTGFHVCELFVCDRGEGRGGGDSERERREGERETETKRMMLETNHEAGINLF